LQPIIVYIITLFNRRSQGKGLFFWPGKNFFSFWPGKFPLKSGDFWKKTAKKQEKKYISHL